MLKNYLNHYNFYLINRSHKELDINKHFSVPLAEKYRKNKHRGLGFTIVASKKHKIGILVSCGDTELQENINILTNRDSRPCRLIKKIEVKKEFLLPYDDSHKSSYSSSYELGGEGGTVNLWFEITKDICLKDIVFHMLDEIIKEERL